MVRALALVGVCALGVGCGDGGEARLTGALSVGGSAGDSDDARDDADDDPDCETTCPSTGGDEDTTGALDPDTPAMAFVRPANNEIVGNPVQFEVLGQAVSRVELIVDGSSSFELDWDPSAQSQYTFSHGFDSDGLKQLELRGYPGESSLVLATARVSIVVDGAAGGDSGGSDGTSGDSGGLPPTSACDGIESQPLIPPTTCDGPSGNTTTEIPANGKYSTSWFGCYMQDDGTIYQDPYDNCEFACGNQGLCPASQDGPTCEANLRWFAADADRYGCGGRIRVTNCDNGNSVVLVTLDRGPNCNTVEKACDTPVLDMSHDAMDYLFDGGTYGGCDHQAVVVEQVAGDTPLGPV